MDKQHIESHVSDLVHGHIWLHQHELFTCNECSEVFTSATHLRSHALVHGGKKKFQCFQCDRFFTRSDHLQTHLKTHDRQLLPLDCSDEHSSTESRPKTGAGHKRLPRGPYICPTCNRQFPLACRLRAHLKVHSGEKDFTCAVCGKQFSLAYRLLLHMRIHTGEKPYECYICQKSFARRHNLKQHLRSHTGDRPYACEVCGKRFTQIKTLKDHVRVHSGERPFECLTCGKKFARVDNLKVHELTHTDNKRHVCPTCGKKYADVRCFQKHVAAHTLLAAADTQSSFQCGVCQTVYRDLRSLRSHSRLQHGHASQTPAVDNSYICGQCGKELTVQTRNRREIVLSANCGCSDEMRTVKTVGDVIVDNAELSDADNSPVNVSQLDDVAVKAEFGDELLNT